MPELPAVRNGEIHFLTEDFLFIPSVRAPLIAERLARAIHPEASHE
jgi:ABC-type Fe3+-hydroxamate transport system substrate-binding protein